MGYSASQVRTLRKNRCYCTLTRAVARVTIMTVSCHVLSDLKESRVTQNLGAHMMWSSVRATHRPLFRRNTVGACFGAVRPDCDTNRYVRCEFG